MLVTSPDLLAELSAVLGRPKFVLIIERARIDPADILAQMHRIAEIIIPPPLLKPVSRDADDDVVLALAAAAKPHVIISGDNDLLSLGSYSGVPIIDAREAIAMLGNLPEL